MKAQTLRSRSLGAFTLLELLVVMVIVAILASLSFAVGPRVLLSIRKQSVQGDMKQLEMGILEYYSEYGRYPISNELQGADIVLGGHGASAGTDEIMNVLLAEPQGWNDGHLLNPKRIQFMSPRPAKGGESSPRNGLGEDGKLYDMWGNEYKIFIDADYDQKLGGSGASDFKYTDRDVENSDGSFSGGIMIQSIGADRAVGKQGTASPDGEGGKRYDGSDDVASWL